MRRFLQITAKILAIFLTAAFVLTLPLSLVAFNLGRVAFSAERMTILLTETVAETGGLRRLVMDSLVEPSDPQSPDGGLDLGAAMSFLSPQEKDYLGEQLTPPGWVDDQLGVLVGAVYEWIDNDQARPVFTVDIASIKVALLSGGAADLVEVVVDSWPPCSVRELAEMSIGALFGGEDFVLCEPPEPLRSGLVGILNASITASLRALPDQLTLGEPGAQEPASPELMQTKERIRLVRFLAGWSWLLSPALLGLVMALAVRTWRGWALWWGIPLILGGLLTVLTMVGVRAVFEEAIRGMLTDAGMPAWIGSVLKGLTTAMLTVTFRRVAVNAFLVLAAGIVVLAAGMILARRQEKRPSAKAASDAATLPLDPTDEEDAGEPPSGMFG